MESTIAWVVVLLSVCCLSSEAQVSLGKFVYNGHGLQGEVILLNDRQYRIKGFSYDGAGPAVWHTGMKKGTIGVYSQDAYAFRNEDNNCDRLKRSYNRRDVVITLPRNMSISRDIETISVYCYRFCHNFGHVKVPRGLKLAAGPSDGRIGGVCKTGHAPCSRDGTRDNAVCGNGNRIGTCPLNGGGGGSRVGGNSNNNNRGKPNNGGGRANNSPARINNSGRRQGRRIQNRPVRLGRFISYANGVVGDVTILNDKQFRVRGFGYSGARGKSTYFLLMERGTVGIHSVKGWAVGDETSKCGGLKSYRGADVIITVPDEINLNNVGAISVYDYEKCVNFGHVRVPGDLVVAGRGGGGRGRGSVCLPYFRPCSRRDTTNPGVCRRGGRSGIEVTC